MVGKERLQFTQSIDNVCHLVVNVVMLLYHLRNNIRELGLLRFVRCVLFLEGLYSTRILPGSLFELSDSLAS